MTFSVIIPVYNSPESYLRECIDSVLNQTYPNVEIIVVNDGSKSADTLRALQEYEEKSDYNGKKLIVRHKENGGQGSARNVGLAIAAGDYTLFLDNDDYYLSLDFFKDISKLLAESNADLLSFQYIEFFDENERPVFSKGKLPRKKVFKQPVDKAIKTLLSAPRSIFSAATHTKVIKTALLHNNGITAPEGISNEDISLTAMIIHHATSFDRYDYVVYAYRRTNSSSISTQHSNSIAISRDILKQFRLILSNEDYKKDRDILDFLASPYIYCLGKIVSAWTVADREQKEAIIDDIKIAREYTYVLKHSSRPYIRIAGIIIQVFGMRFMMFLMSIYLTLNNKHMLSLHRRIVD